MNLILKWNIYYSYSGEKNSISNKRVGTVEALKNDVSA